MNIGWLDNEEACFARTKRSTGEGCCVAWIRNSIDDAVRIYHQLLSRGVIPAEKISLFHSRFAFYDHQRIERGTLPHFGKDDSTQWTGGVPIATQVIEQSLDIDVDDMILDLASIDLLTQHTDRLQRHVRDRHGRLDIDGEDERTPPQLVILAPEWDEAP